MSVNYHSVSLEAYDLLIVTPRLLVKTYGASDDFKGFFLAIDEGSYNGMMASDSAFSHLTLFYTTHQVPLLHCPKRGGDIVIGLMDQLSRLMKCAVTNVYIDKMMMLVEQVEKPRAFDPRRRAALTPSGKKSLTPRGKIKMTPGKISFRGLFCSFGIRLDQRVKPKHLKS